MRKLLVSIFSILVVLGSFTPSSSAAQGEDYCEQFEGVNKIWWDGIELKQGQIGRLTIIKDTPLYKVEGEIKIISRTLKAGEFYRIYAFKPGMLSVGGGYYVDRDENVSYQTPSKTKLNAVKCINNTYQPAQPAKPEQEKPQNTTDEDIPFDITRSIIHLGQDKDYNYNWVVFDKDKDLLKTIPLKTSVGWGEMAINNNESFYIKVWNPINSQIADVWRVDINQPTNMKKVISDLPKSYAVNNNSLFYDEINTTTDKNGWVFWDSLSIYKTNLDGSNKELFLELPVEYAAKGILAVDDDYLYVYFEDYSTSVSEVQKIDVETGEISTLRTLDYMARDVRGQDGYIVVTDREIYGNTNSPTTITFYTTKGEKLYSLNRDKLGTENFLMEYNNKLYFFDYVDFTIKEVDKNGNLKEVKKMFNNIRVLDIDNNHIYYVDPQNSANTLKQKIVN